MTHKKPHPALFLTAVERLGVAAASSLVIEDAPNGVAAARSAGCRCLAVTNSVPATALADADRVVDTLAAITLGDVLELIHGSHGSGGRE